MQHTLWPRRCAVAMGLVLALAGCARATPTVPTATAVPPTEIAVAEPTETVPVAPAETAAPTETALAPTETAAPTATAAPTETAVPPTATAAPTEMAPPAETAVPTETSTAPEGWLALAEPAWGYTLSYPPTWEECTTTPNSHVFCVPQAEPGGLVPPVFFVTVIPPGFTNEQAEAYNFMPEALIRQFAGLPVGESLATDEFNPDFFTYTRLEDTSVGGESAVVIENERVWEAPQGVKERRVLVRREEATYLFGAYYETPEALADFETVLATVEFAGE